MPLNLQGLAQDAPVLLIIPGLTGKLSRRFLAGMVGTLWSRIWVVGVCVGIGRSGCGSLNHVTLSQKFTESGGQLKMHHGDVD